VGRPVSIQLTLELAWRVRVSALLQAPAACLPVVWSENLSDLWNATLLDASALHRPIRRRRRARRSKLQYLASEMGTEVKV
jgi:hypothetical protein